MAKTEVITGLLSVATIVASEALSWGLSPMTTGMLFGLAGWVAPRPSDLAARKKKDSVGVVG